MVSSGETESENVHQKLLSGEEGISNLEKLEEGFQQNRSCVKKYLGIILTLVSGMFYSLSVLIAKYLKDFYHPVLISVWRFQGALLPCFLIIAYRILKRRQSDFDAFWPITGSKLKMTTFCILMLRGIIGATAVVFQFYSIKYMDVADSMAIITTSSVFVTILAPLCINEKCGWMPLFTSTLTTMGVFVISRPPVFTGKESFDKDLLVGICLALGCMGVSTAVVIMQRYLRSVHYSLISFSSGFWGTIECVILAWILNAIKLPETIMHTFLVIALAIFALFAQVTLILALKYEEAGPVAIVQTGEVVSAFMWQFLLLGVVPDVFSVIGSSAVITGVVLTAYSKWVNGLPAAVNNKKTGK